MNSRSPPSTGLDGGGRLPRTGTRKFLSPVRAPKRSMMVRVRVLLAAHFVCAGLGGLVVLSGALGVFEQRGAVLYVVFTVAPLALIAIAYLLFNRRSLRRPGVSVAETVARLERTGQLERTELTARSAFPFDEFEAEAPSWFTGRADGGVLFPSSQYLHDFDPDVVVETCTFPCERLRVLRHATRRYVVDIECAGDALAPDATAPAFSVKEHEADRVAADGYVLRAESYDSIQKRWFDPRRATALAAQ